MLAASAVQLVAGPPIAAAGQAGSATTQASPRPPGATPGPGQVATPSCNREAAAPSPRTAARRRIRLAWSRQAPRPDRPSGGRTPSPSTRKAVKLKPTYVEGYWYQGTAYYTLDNFAKCREAFRKVVRLAPKNGAAFAFLGLCEFGLKDYDRSLQHLLQSQILRRRRHRRSWRRRALPRRDPDDPHGAVRAGARNARGVRQRRQRQCARHRGDGHRDAAHADAADRIATRSARDGADGRPGELHDGDAEYRVGAGRRSRRSSPAIPKRRTCTTPTASISCRSSRTRRSRNSSAS